MAWMMDLYGRGALPVVKVVIVGVANSFLFAIAKKGHCWRPMSQAPNKTMQHRR